MNFGELGELGPYVSPCEKDITAAAARCVPILDIGKELGLTPNQWLERLRDPAVALALAQGRAQAQVRLATALRVASEHGKAEAALFILRRDHGWPAPRRGRPPKAVGPEPPPSPPSPGDCP